MPSQAARHIKSIVASNIRAARGTKGLTQRELAVALDVDSMSVSRWERAKVMPDGALTVPRIADTLGVTVAWLYTDHDAEAAA